MTTEQINQAIMIQVATGKTIDQAIDTVLGAGTFATIASDLYDSLRK